MSNTSSDEELGTPDFCHLRNKYRMQNILRDSLSSGLWASIGSTAGKLSGTSSIVGENYLLRIPLLIFMVAANTWGCRYYLRSLDAASNSVIPTVLSSASNYILSGVIGIALFGEGASLLWWGGATLIIIGMSLVATPQKKHNT